MIVGGRARESSVIDAVDWAGRRIGILTLLVGLFGGAIVVLSLEHKIAADDAATAGLAAVGLLIAAGLAWAALRPVRANALRHTPEELAQLVGYVRLVDGRVKATPLGDRAVEAYNAWPKPIDPPLTVEEAAWKPLR